MIENGYCFCLNKWVLDIRIKNELPLLLIISSMTAKTGETLAKNKFFADLFNCTEVSISGKISKLEKLGYIEIEYEKRGCEVIKRKIRLKNILTDDSKIFYSTIKKDFKDNNNINNNNIYIQTKNKNDLLESKKNKDINNIINNINPEIKDAMVHWLEYKKEKGDKYKPIGLKDCIKKLEKLSGNNKDLAMKIVEQSTSNSWSGLFPLKEKQEAGIKPYW